MAARFSLRLRFLFSLLIILLVICGAFAFALTRQASDTLENNIDKEARSFAALSVKPIGDSFVLYKDGGSARIYQQVSRFTDLNTDIKGVAIADVDGKVLFQNQSYTEVSVTPEQAASLDPNYLYKDGQLESIVQPYIEDFGVHRYNIIYQISHESVDQAARTIAVNFLIYCLLGLAISLGLAYPIMNYLFVRPVAKISKSALSVSKGNLNEQIELDRDDEIGDLARAVNTMAQSLRNDIEKLKAVDKLKSEFLAITSHNLRTPISIIKGYLEQLEDMNPSPEIKKVLHPINASTLQLGAFAEEVLTISTIEAGSTINVEPVKLSSVINPLVTQFEVIAAEKKLVFKPTLEDDPTVKINSNYLRTALWNLLDNAAKFTKENGEVSLSTKSEGGNAVIIIKDTGIGIESSEVPQLFTKFHRGTGTLTYDFEGVGIGLYITKLIIDQHGGKIKVDSVIGKGTVLTITLPLASV